MIGVQIPGHIAHGDLLIGRPFQLARTEHPGHIPIEEEPQQHLGRIGLPAFGPVARIDGRQVQHPNRIHHEARQMLRRQQSPTRTCTSSVAA